MINNIQEFLRRVDQFGANYKPSYAYGEVQFKTSLGGLLSILLYGASLSYLIYELILWRSGQILPKVTSMATEVETYTLKFDQVTVAEFCLRRHKSILNQIDPFEPENMILLPMLYKVVEDQLQIPQPLLSKKLSQDHNMILIELKNIELVNNEHEELDQQNIEYTIMFEECDQTVLPEGWNCAKEERVKEFFSQKQNQLFIRTFVNQYNTSTKQLELIEQDYYASFDNKTTYFSQMSFGTSNVSVDTGFLFESIQTHEFPSQIISYIQQMDLDYFTHTFEKDVFIVFEFELGTLQQTIFIEYPKVSEVLANIGSIISFFLFFSNVAYMINEKTLEDRVIRAVIEMYYPQFKNIKFIQNWYSKIIGVKYQDKSIPFNKFMQKYHDLTEIARQKLCLTNSLYEISRLQFILRSNFDSEILSQSHSIGIKLNILDSSPDPEEKSEIQQINNNKVHDFQVENVDDQSLDEIRVQPQNNNHHATLDINVNSVINIEQLQKPQSIFIGQANLQFSNNQQYDHLKLTDEDFYILMQNQQEIKFENSKQQSTLYLQKISDININAK
ncbi:unnamed protein product [Paramecium primaurelia]|uniref:Transmembrane protein n=1 Tax=Paramecium primaurelia TaxID=5886 RepID=A0A8S1KQY0_PARPR|nr:unnamed protein product [Paramecium primaurelia]